MHSNTIYATQKHLDQIVKLWGLNRSTLGLMPKDAFIEAIRKKWVIIQLDGEVVTGYLQFRFTQRTQTLSIVHLCIDIEFRGKRYSDVLLNKLVNDFRYMARGIKLNCRSDYSKAIAFWDRYGFQPKDKLPSRGSDPNVHLVVWWYSFGTIDLFSLNGNEKVKAILDFNIIAKMMDPDLDESARTEIMALQDDWLVSEVDYYINSETKNEIFRDRNKERQARSQQYLKRFSEVNIDKADLLGVDQNLSQIYSGITDNDKSDRRQIAESILSGYAYFVTMDEGILRHQKEVMEEFGLKIVRPAKLISEIDSTVNFGDYFPDKLSGNNFQIGKLKSIDRDDLDTLFLSHSTGEKKAVFNKTIDNAIASSNGLVTLITEGSEKAAIIVLEEYEDHLKIPIIRTRSCRLEKTIFMQNITDLLEATLERKKQFLIISDFHLSPAEKIVLLEYGFFEVDNIWIRGVCEGITSIKSIGTDLQKIKTRIPQLDRIISEVSATQDINFYLNMLSLEKLLWPLKIREAEIPCFIIPIKPQYARTLFDTKAARGELFGVEPSLIWSKENVYYRAINPNVESFPARILWYVSEGKNMPRSKTIVCASYLNEVITGSAKELFKSHERYGIYNWKRDIFPMLNGDPNKPIKVLRFSDSEVFRTPITLLKAKKILFDNMETDNNFQSPKMIKSSTFMQIYALGKGLRE